METIMYHETEEVKKKTVYLQTCKLWQICKLVLVFEIKLIAVHVSTD